MRPTIPQKAGAKKTPEGTANKRSALQSPTQHAATSYAVRCDGRCSALRQSVRNTIVRRGTQKDAPGSRSPAKEDRFSCITPMPMVPIALSAQNIRQADERGILLGQQPPAHALQTAPKQRPESKQACPDASAITSNTSSQTGSRPCAPRSCRAWRRS